MNTPIAFSSRVTTLRAIALAASFLVGLAVSPAQAAPKSDEAKPAAPVSVSFEKTDGDNGPYVMTVTNTGSEDALVKVTVIASVQVHNKPKKREFPQTKVAPGAGMNVNEIAANDHVMVVVKGFAAVQLTAPTGTN